MTSDHQGLAQFTPLTPPHGQNGPTVQDVESMLVYLFPDQVKAGLLRALEAMNYTYGPPIVERKRELEKLNAEIAETEAEEAAIVEELESMRRELVQ